MNDDFKMSEVQPPLSRVGGLAFSSATVVYVVLAFFAGLLIKGLKIEEGSSAFVYISYLVAPVAIVAVTAFFVGTKKISAKQAFPLKCHPKYFAIAILLVFGLQFSVGYIDAPVLEFFKLLGYRERGSGAYFPNLEGGLVVPAFLVMAIMPAIFEEALFRGVILNSCKKSMGSIPAVLSVGLCFMLFHASPEQTVYQFIAGCAFAFIAVRSGSILPSVLMHFINNGLIVIFAACGLFDEAGQLVMPQTAFIVVTTLSALSFAGAAVWLALDKKRGLVKGDKAGVIQFYKYAALGIIALTLSWILNFVMSGANV